MGIELLKRMIELYSPSGSEAPLAQLLCDEMARRGFQAELDAVGNAIGQIGSGPVKIYLVGHMDTVAGEIPVRVENGKLFGRGSVDAKGCLAAFVEAGSSHADSKNISIIIIGCVAEEADSYGAKFLIESNKHRPHYVVIGEPSGWDAITLGYKGSVNLNFHLVQEQHHGGHAEPTAAEQAIEVFDQLKMRYGSAALSFDTAHLKLKAFNTHHNGFEEIADFHINLRTPIGFDFAELRQFLRSLPKNLNASMGEETPAFRADKQNPLVRSFLKAIRAVNGTPSFKVKTGTSDMNLLGPAWGVPIIAYGPGDSSLDHTPHEHIVIAEYEKAVAVLKQALELLVDTTQHN